MEIGIPFELNSEFNQYIDPRKRGVLPYEQMSSGQKARINLAIMFALIEFAELKSGSRINLLLLDEVIESSGLDSEGKENILGIIKHSVKKKMIMITHDQSVRDSFEKFIKIERVGRFSTIEEG